MRGCKSERQESFESHPLGHMDQLRRYGLHLIGNPADADDLVQEAYLTAFRFWDTCAPDAQVSAWLFRILKNSFVIRYRRESHTGSAISYVESVRTGRWENAGGEVRSPVHDTVLAASPDDDVTDVLAGLPDPFRAIW